MNIYTIYRATNTITNKVYIGFTSETVLRRSLGHKRDAFIEQSDAKFHKALREYGWDTFVFEAIYQAKEVLPPRESHTCKVMEDIFINEYNSLEDGYNAAPGGGAWPIMKGEEHPLYGIGHSTATKKKIKDNHHDVSGANNPRARRVVLISSDGIRYDAFGNLSEVCGQIGIPPSTAYIMLSKNKHLIVRGKFKGLQVYYEENYERDRLTDQQIRVMLQNEYIRQCAAAAAMSVKNKKG